MPSSLPTLLLPPPLRSGDASSVTAVPYYDDVTITSCSLNLILFLTIYSNIVTSSYHHHVACWGQSLYYCMLVILCSVFFFQISFIRTQSINYYYYYLTTFNDFCMINNHSLFQWLWFLITWDWSPPSKITSILCKISRFTFNMPPVPTWGAYRSRVTVSDLINAPL